MDTRGHITQAHSRPQKLCLWLGRLEKLEAVTPAEEEVIKYVKTVTMIMPVITIITTDV